MGSQHEHRNPAERDWPEGWPWACASGDVRPTTPRPFHGAHLYAWRTGPLVLERPRTPPVRGPWHVPGPHDSLIDRRPRPGRGPRPPAEAAPILTSARPGVPGPRSATRSPPWVDPGPTGRMGNHDRGQWLVPLRPCPEPRRGAVTSAEPGPGDGPAFMTHRRLAGLPCLDQPGLPPRPGLAVAPRARGEDPVEVVPADHPALPR